MLILSLKEEDSALLNIDPRVLLQQNPNGETVTIEVKLLRWPNGSYRVGLIAPRYVQIHWKLRKPPRRRRQKGGDQ